MNKNELIKEGTKTVNIIFAMFKNRHHLYNVLSREELEDMKQEGMLSMLQKIDGFEPERGFTLTTFLSQRILGTFKDYIKKELTREKRQAVIIKQIKETYTPFGPPDNVGQYALTLKNLKITKKLTKDLDIYIEEIDNHDIIEAIGELTDKEKYIIVNYYVLGRKVKDIAYELGYSLGWVSNIKMKGIRKLQKLLTEDLM